MEVQFVIHYLDDFLVEGGSGYQASSTQLGIVPSTFNELGILVAMNTLEGTTYCLTFLGFELDTGAMEV